MGCVFCQDTQTVALIIEKAGYKRAMQEHGLNCELLRVRRKQLSDLISKNRVKYLLLVHIIFVVKYRKKLLVTYGTEVKDKMIEIASMNNFTHLRV